MGFATAAAVVGAGTSLYQGIKGAKAAKKSGKQADQALALQNKALDQSIELGEEQLQYFKGVYDEWREEYAPILTELKNEALENRTPDYAAIAADTDAAFDAVRENRRLELGRYGIKPGDGQFNADERRIGVGEAGAEVNARQAARRAEEDKRFDKLNRVYGLGVQQQGQALAGVSNASGQYQHALGGNVRARGDQATRYGNAAAGASDAAFGQDWDGIINGVFGAFGGGDEGGSQDTTQPVGTGLQTGASDWRPPGYVGEGG